MFSIRRVEQQSSEAVEWLGTKSKFWFSDGERRLLFKAEQRGTGEDWSEKIACQLCELLGLPHVHYELAELTEQDRPVCPGVVCETCAPGNRTLILGNQLLLQRDPQYPAGEGGKYKVQEYTVDSVAAVIGELEPPAAEWMTGCPSGIATALETFVGFVMLDAWIANQDRHHENWSALQCDDALRLAPTYDHGASLARNLSDEERHERLTTNDRGRAIPHFAARARSAFFLDATQSRPLSTLDAFTAFAHQAPAGAAVWIKQLASVDESAVSSILDEVPPTRMSRISKDFTLQLLLENQKRIGETEIG